MISNAEKVSSEFSGRDSAEARQAGETQMVQIGLAWFVCDWTGNQGSGI